MATRSRIQRAFEWTVAHLRAPLYRCSRCENFYKPAPVYDFCRPCTEAAVNALVRRDQMAKRINYGAPELAILGVIHETIAIMRTERQKRARRDTAAFTDEGDVMLGRLQAERAKDSEPL